MKRIITLLCAAALATSFVLADETADITFEKREHDFGIVAKDTCVVSCTFKFTNTGRAPLIIHQAISSCGCTVPEFSQEPIAPGESGHILVTYNGKTKRAGVFKKSISIFSNATTSPLYVYIKGEMIDNDNIEELIPARSEGQTAGAGSEPAEEVAEVPRGKGFLSRLFGKNKVRKDNPEKESK